MTDSRCGRQLEIILYCSNIRPLGIYYRWLLIPAQNTAYIDNRVAFFQRDATTIIVDIIQLLCKNVETSRAVLPCAAHNTEVILQYYYKIVAVIASP